jgi:hypothetical protein
MNDRKFGRPRPPARRDAPGRGRPHQPNRNGAGNVRAKYERYLALAREAAQAGDEVEKENFYQHAEHYFREMNNRD